MTDCLPIPLSVVGMIRQAARTRGLRDEAVPAALGEMSRDLFPDVDWFPVCFSGSFPVSGFPPGWRVIGDAFWRGSAGTREERRLDGSFYTPDAVIDHILDLVRADLRGSVCDPAVGCGYFLLRLLDRLKARHGAAKTRRWAASFLCGADLNPAAVLMTRILLWLSLSDGRREFLPDPLRIRQGDSLLGSPFESVIDGGFDCIIGNPPYEVLTNFSRHPERRVLAGALRASGFYRDSLSGQINLYRCFVERSLAWLRPGGVLSFVVPLSLARDAAAELLRKRLLEQESAAEWALFAERDAALGGVTQAACVFRAVRGAGAARRITVRAPASAPASGGTGRGSSVTLAELRKNGGGVCAIPMLDASGLALWRWLWKHASGRLDGIADMRVGEVDQTVFRDCMRDDAPNGGGVCVLARGAHLAPFRLDVRPVPGKERFLDLDLFLQKKGASAGLCRERASVARVAQMGIRNMDTRPRLVAALLPPGVYAGNSLNVYTPKDGVSAEFLAGLLNARILDWLFRAASGNNNINLAEMRGLPVPALTDAALAAEIAAAFRDADRSRLDAAVEAAYGAPQDLVDAVFTPIS